MKIRELNEAISKALNEEVKPIKAIKPTAEQTKFSKKSIKEGTGIEESVKDKKAMKEDEYSDAAKAELELFILEEINPIYDTLTKLRSLLRDADEDGIADSLDTVIDFIDKY